MSFSSSSQISRLALGFCIAAFIFDIIGFPSNDWLTSTSSSSIGLFRICVLGICANYDASANWWSAVIALESIGFLCGLASLIVVITFVVIKNDVKLLQIVALTTAFVAGIVILLGVIIFRTMYEEQPLLQVFNLGWSFALTIIGALLYLVTGVSLVVDRLKG